MFVLRTLLRVRKHGKSESSLDVVDVLRAIEGTLKTLYDVGRERKVLNVLLTLIFVDMVTKCQPTSLPLYRKQSKKKK